MKLLVIKISSMGDIIHSLPALTDAKAALPELEIDWVVEEGFADIPKAHPAINKIIVIAMRRWRKNPLKYLFSKEVRHFYKSLRQTNYDIVLDAQGLPKTVILAWLAKGKEKHGLHRKDSRGHFDLGYTHKHRVNFNQHAVARVRELFAASLNYNLPTTEPNYGLTASETKSTKKPYLLFIHGTTWTSKEWPEPYWQQLAQLAVATGFDVKLPAGNANERARAERIASGSSTITVLPPCSLKDLITIAAGADGAVALDTGLAHLVTALNQPCVSIFGASDAKLNGTYGPKQLALSAKYPCSPCLKRQCIYTAQQHPPCYQTLPPKLIWRKLSELLAAGT